MSIRSQSEVCAAELPTGLFLVDDLIMIEIVYYTFKLWQACHQQNAASCSISSFYNRHPRRAYRFAQMSSRKAFENHGVDVNGCDLSPYVDHLLTHCTSLPNQVVMVCCAETISEDIANVSRIAFTSCQNDSSPDS